MSHHQLHSRARKRRQVLSPTPSVPRSSPLRDTFGLSLQINDPYEGLVVGDQSVHPCGESAEVRDQWTINELPDDALLEIFDSYVGKGQGIQEWHTLVHVCRRWRSIVFSSARRLDLRLFCTYTTPVRKTLYIWPALPIMISDGDHRTSRVKGTDNIIAALEHHPRVCHIHLEDIPVSVLKRLAAAMQDPFPILADLVLASKHKKMPALPDSFLGGSAPRLCTLFLNGIPFPAVPKLLLSAVDLVFLSLWNVPHPGYVPPEAIFSCLSALTRLESFELGFQSPQSCPDRTSRSPPRLTRTVVLPALTYFWFQGVSEYLEDLVARIDAPLLDTLAITFFNQLIFDTPQLFRFIGNVEKLKSPNRAHVAFDAAFVQIRFSPRTLEAYMPVYTTTPVFELRVSCRGPDWQLSSLAQLCSSSLPPFSTLEHLDVREDQRPRPNWQDDTEKSQWLELLRPFSAVKSLSLSRELARCVMLALQELAREGPTDTLPALQNLSLEVLRLSQPVRTAIEQFVAARRLSGHPIVVSHLEGGR